MKLFLRESSFRCDFNFWTQYKINPATYGLLFRYPFKFKQTNPTEGTSTSLRSFSCFAFVTSESVRNLPDEFISASFLVETPHSLVDDPRTVGKEWLGDIFRAIVGEGALYPFAHSLQVGFIGFHFLDPGRPSLPWSFFSNRSGVLHKKKADSQT